MEQIIQQHFGGALKNAKMFDEVNTLLRLRGFTSTKGSKEGNTLLATSCCPDEINRDLENHDNNIWGRAYTMGGLCGFPFVGKTGFASFIHHVPEGGNIFIIAASHIGITPNGDLGLVRRDGMTRDTPACGSNLGAFEFVRSDPTKAEQLANGDATIFPMYNDPLDSQQAYVQKVVAKCYAEVSTAQHPPAALAKATYTAIRKDLDEILKQVKPNCAVAFLGGVQINVEEKGAALGEDWFYVRDFELRRLDGSIEDLKPLLEHQQDKKSRKSDKKAVKKLKKDKK